MAYVLDGIAILAIVGLGVLGVFRGFLKMVLPVVGVVLSLVLAAQFATPLSEKIYDSMFKGDLTRAVEVKIQEDGFEGNAVESVNKLLEVMPEKPKQTIEKYYGKLEAKNYLKIAGESERVKGQKAIDAVIENVVRPAMINTFTGGCFLALFVVFMALSVVAIIMIIRMSSMAGLNTFNRVLGFVAGAAGGVVLTVVMATFVSISAASAQAAKVEDPVFAPDTLENTMIVQHFELMKDNDTVKNIRNWSIETAKTKAAADKTVASDKKN